MWQILSVGRRKELKNTSGGASTPKKHQYRWFTPSGLPWWLSGRESAHNAGDTAGNVGSILGWEDPLEKEMATTPVFLPGESHRQRSLVGYSPWGRKRVGHD